METKKMLKIEALSKKIKQHEIINDLNLTVDSGELVHIMGINGSGKSTLFKIIANIMEPSSGTVTLFENVEIGALIENPSFMETSTAKENMKFLSQINHHYNEKRISDLFSKLDLDYNSREKINKYSLGMRQKVGIIQAIMENQNLILLDEPTRGLDKKALETFGQMVMDLISEGKSIIIASHENLSELEFTTRYELVEGDLQKL